MSRIALFLMRPDWPLARQCPGGALAWADCRFAINPEGGTFDYCAVYDGLPLAARLSCPPDKTLFITGEPPSIKHYDERFLGQFHQVLTHHSDLPHPRRIFDQQSYLWYAGIGRPAAGRMTVNLSYDDFAAMPVSEKTGLLSLVASDKAITPGHRHRRAFARRLRDHFGERVAIFGRGIRDVVDKAEAIAPYRYHIVMESSQFPDYWTEKLADSYLCSAYPFYWGCPNLERYFPAGAFTPIDIYDPERSIGVIEREIAADRFAAALPELERARRLVLDTYNIFAMLAERCGAPSALPAEAMTIRPESHYRDSLRKKLRKRLWRAVPRVWRGRAAKSSGGR
jgi:hypothetical protein